MDKKQILLEWYKCRKSPFYFINNYFHFSELYHPRRYDLSLMHTKLRRTVRACLIFHRVILMASRQLGKSTIAAGLLLWACLFYPGTLAVIINYRKSTAYDNIEKVKFAYNHLPPWLKIPLKSDPNIKHYIDFAHGSRLSIFYPSSNTPPEQLARGLTGTVLYIDEAAFIRGIHEAYTAAQPALSRAREQAKHYNYPYFILLSSTPNGVEGTGKWFYQMWENAIDDSYVFAGDSDLLRPDYMQAYQEAVSSELKNGFIRIKYHWSEDPEKDEQWYLEQCRELNWDERAIAQELDLEFRASTECVFPDDVLKAIKPESPKFYVNLSEVET